MSLHLSTWKKVRTWDGKEPLIPIKDAAKKLFLTVNGLRYYINKLNLHIYKIGGKLYLEKKQVDNFSNLLKEFPRPKRKKPKRRL